MATEDEVTQLAIFTAALDARRFGAEMSPGVFRPTWEERGDIGQAAYLADAAIQFRAVELIQTGQATRLLDLVGGESR
ncbi:hypothetical protein LLS1_18730 [Leifsonia sp. LS1]|uniref:hypothetical protein n=1 Tax=Leifsonia sp. LS1 TaxID=2828483 RepID=UPI001CFE698A|nr:hypothetical protein [Leifsonia sp. LS1]GIT80204.1 hypothetical protein LLS1_18730 [Leifsonia sp. LS1]